MSFQEWSQKHIHSGTYTDKQQKLIELINQGLSNLAVQNLFKSGACSTSKVERIYFEYNYYKHGTNDVPKSEEVS